MRAYQKFDPTESPDFHALRRFVEQEMQEPGSEPRNFEEFERRLHEHISKWEAELVARRLARYDVDADEIEVRGRRFRKKLRCQQEYCCQAGPFTVERNLYVPRSGAGGRAICPMELRAGIVAGAWTPRAARIMAHAVALSTPREAESFFAELGGMKPSASSLDRLPKRLSETWESNREDFEAELRAQETIPAEAVTVSVSLDGVQAPMKDAGRAEKRSPRAT